MIYAVEIEQTKKIRGYYFDKDMAQEHVDWINNQKGKSIARVVAIRQKGDEKGDEKDGTH